MFRVIKKFISSSILQCHNLPLALLTPLLPPHHHQYCTYQKIIAITTNTQLHIHQSTTIIISNTITSNTVIQATINIDFFIIRAYPLLHLYPIFIASGTKISNYCTFTTLTLTLTSNRAFLMHTPPPPPTLVLLPLSYLH